MGFSSEWNSCYEDNQQISIWPWSDMVSLVSRFFIPKNIAGDNRLKVLELGCGAGANIPFFLKLEAEYYGIEGSHTIVRYLKEKYPTLKENILLGDFTQKIELREKKFDLILDRAAVTHNNTKSIVNTLEAAHDLLLCGGMYIGIDWFSTNHSDYHEGEPIDDIFTRTNYIHGQFAGVGKVHFSNLAHLKELFKKFKLQHLEEKTIKRFEPNDQHQFAAWNIVAIKRP